MKKILSDLHTHTQYSFDSSATMQQYVDVAIEKGVKIICFTDHIECGGLNTFKDFEFGKRAEEFHILKERYAKDVKLLLGFEVGEPHKHPKEMQFLRTLLPDMIIGSVHDANFYEPPRAYTNFEHDRLNDKYVYEMVCEGGFEVLGHMDLMRRYHDDYIEDVEHIHKTLEMCVKNGIVPEANTSEFRHGKNYTLPNAAAFEYYLSVGGKYVTIDSDAHIAANLCANFEKAADTLPEKLKLCYFEQRKLIEL